MAIFITFQTEAFGPQNINPDKVQRVGQYSSGDTGQRAIVYFSKDDWIVVMGNHREVADALST